MGAEGHFSDGETEAERVSGLPEVTECGRKLDLCSGSEVCSPSSLAKPCALGPVPCLCPQGQPGRETEMEGCSNVLSQDADRI